MFRKRKPDAKTSLRKRPENNESSSSDSVTTPSKKASVASPSKKASDAELSTSISSAGEKSSTSDEVVYNSSRVWLEQKVDDKGQPLHFADLLPRLWDPNGSQMKDVKMYEYNDINEAITKINKDKEHYNFGAARVRLVELAKRAPKNPDVLQYCRNFAKERNDKVAEEGYLRCLIQLDPSDSSSISDRIDILEIVDKADNCLLNEIETLMKQYNQDRPETPELTQQRKKAFIELSIYNTVAIEGNTMTPDEVRTVCESPETLIPGHSQAEHDEVKGMIHVIDFIAKEKLSTKTIKLEDILKMHEHVLLDKPKNKGKLRDTEVALSNVPFVPVHDVYVEAEMKKVVKFMNNKPKEMSGVEFAALVSYAFVYVHPFADGNGRVSRLLMNMALEDYRYPPIIVPYSKRDEYYNSIYFGNMGDLRQFIRFIANLLIARLEVYKHNGAFSPVETDEPVKTIVLK
ncbi:fic/DOC family domain-containing protein [Ditylenchus destructor]|nr:fic/DOC family domain-containing protein [Ditylenchus destructor]